MAIGPTTYFKMKKTVFLHQGVLGSWAFDGKSARSFFEEEWSQVDDSGGGAQPWMENIKTVIALPFSKWTDLLNFSLRMIMYEDKGAQDSIKIRLFLWCFSLLLPDLDGAFTKAKHLAGEG